MQTKRFNRFAALGACLGLLSVGCPSDEAPVAKTDTTTQKKAVNEVPPPTPKRDALKGGPYPSLFVAQAWFYKNAKGKPTPGPARLQIWRDTGAKWEVSTLEDADSNVFHKAMPYDGGILTIGAEKALVKKWTHQDGKWADETIWEQSWGGRFNRMRDIEIGDVDGDGKDELVIATHDSGVVAVVNPDEGAQGIIEMDKKADTFVHEIEIGDINGDGRLEFFATPTDRNKVGVSQAGAMVMYQWNGKTYQRTVVDPMGDTHAKEILAADIDGDGRSEIFSVLEAHLNEKKEIVSPVEIRQYTAKKDGTFTHKAIGTIQDRQTRFLVPGDFDGDGQQELIAAAMKTGLWMMDLQKDGSWKMTNIEKVSSGFEHTTYASDLDGDGQLELYVAADDQNELRRYTYDKGTKGFKKEVLGRLPNRTITWNITTGKI